VAWVQQDLLFGDTHRRLAIVFQQSQTLSWIIQPRSFQEEMPSTDGFLGSTEFSFSENEHMLSWFPSFWYFYNSPCCIINHLFKKVPNYIPKYQASQSTLL
jgi:hypothetical protein